MTTYRYGPRASGARRLRAGAAVLAVSLAITACGGDGGDGGDGEAADSDEPIVIGGISDLTGDLAPLGISQQQMAELAVKHLNEDGGVLGRELQIEYVDGASDPARWATSVEELLDYPMVIGALTGAERDAIKDTVTESSIYIQPTLTDGDGECLDYMFTTGPVPEQQMIPFLDFLIEQAGGNRVYFLGSDYNFPRSANAITIEHLEANGGTVVGEDYFALDATDFATAVRTIEQEQPDVVFSNVIPPASFSLIRQLNEAGLWDSLVIGTPGSDEGWLFGVEPDQISGMYSALDYYEGLDDEATVAIRDAYVEEYGEEPPISAAGGASGAYRGVMLWADAVEAAGSLDRDAVQEAMHTAETDRAPGGPAQMVEGTRHARVPTYIGHFTTDTIEVLEPIEPADPTQCGS